MSTLSVAIIGVICFVSGIAFLFSLLYIMTAKKNKPKTKRKNCPNRTDVSQPKSLLARIGVMNLILVIIAITLLSFTIVMIDVFKTYGTIPDTLVTCVFLVCGTECGAMSWIKTNKDKLQQRKWDLEDEKRMDEKAMQYDKKADEHSSSDKEVHL